MLDADRTSALPNPYGVWVGRDLQTRPTSAQRSLAQDVEALGFSALWTGGSYGADLSVPAELLDATDHLVVGTSIANIWRDPAKEVASSYSELAARFGHRFILGLGAGHASQVQWNENRYRRPLAVLAEFLDALDDADPPVPPDRRALAALGPKALALAGERSLGALPLLTTPTHTRDARAVLGLGPLLAPGQKVILETDPEQARERARADLEYYLTLPNYVQAWRRMGFDDSDFTDKGSDRLIDAIYAWGEPTTLVSRLQEHLDAGADHVCIQPIPEEGRTAVDDLRLISETLHL